MRLEKDQIMGTAVKVLKEDHPVQREYLHGSEEMSAKLNTKNFEICPGCESSFIRLK